MVDKVKPLKLENSTDGTEENRYPTEADPSEDYLSCKGLALENSNSTLIYGDSGVLKFKDAEKTIAHSLDNILDAEYEDFDPTTTTLTSTKTGPAIRELFVFASNCFSWSTIINGQTITVPQYQQMLAYDEIDIDGGGTLDIIGQVIIFD